MRKCLDLLFVVVFGLSAGVVAWSQEPSAAERAEQPLGLDSYIVGRNDTLYSIAKRYNTSVRTLQALNGLTESRLVAEGQSILVPKLDRNEVESYVIQPGDSLYEIAKRYGTTVETLQSMNGIGDRQYIYSGQTILLPKTSTVAFRPGFAFGITLFAHQKDTAELARQVEELDVNWAKLEVVWAEIEPSQAAFQFAELDAIIEALDALDVKILLNVYGAPDWARGSYVAHLSELLQANAGPPEDPATFDAFLLALAKRYKGVVDGYEIWKSPNLLKYWTVPVYEKPPKRGPDGDYGFPDKIQIGAGHYIRLLERAYHVIKGIDSDAQVITAGLAPVGFSDNYNSIETGRFLRNMLGDGASEVSDGIGAIFGASAVPPRLFCCDQPPGIDTHYESYMQYFREVLGLYQDILVEYQLGDMPIYVTQVGWGTTDGSRLAVPASGLEWLHYTDEDEQALYIMQAFELVQSMETIEGMFLYNLNGCSVGDREACFFSLYDANGVARPAYSSFAEIQKSQLDN